MQNQRGVSLLSIVFVGVLVVLFLVYARPFFGIPYTGYKVGSIMSSVIREGNTKEYEVQKTFDERIAFENILDIVSSKDLTIMQGDKGIQITAEYEHCAELWTNWTVCAQMTITR